MQRTEPVRFEGYDGQSLDARLEWPDTTPRAFALFAHCFSCGKDSLAATRISRRLTDHGYAVMRFDFTGLGKSEGDFANTNFSSNVGDLIAASRWLENNHGKVSLIIGHSLGGAAAIVAANSLPDISVVATIGAPADASHILRQFSSRLDEIHAHGEAEINLAHNPFTIRHQFVEDVRDARVKQAANALKRPIMILHSPVDQVVGIDNATELFLASRHPRSFVSLDHADHMLSERRDAETAADVIAAWADRYVPETLPAQTSSETGPPRGKVRVEETGAGHFANLVTTGPHAIPVDEPVDVGGTDTGPTPTEYLSAALGACTTITLRMYLDRKSWPVDHIAAHVHFTRAETADETGWKPVTFHRELEVTGDLSDDQRSKLVEIANKCPVHKILHHASEIETVLKATR